MGVHYISAEHLTIERVGQIVSEGVKLSLSEDARNRITRCREYLNRKMENNAQPIYGVTTGFGSLCNISVGAEDLGKLQKNLVLN